MLLQAAGRANPQHSRAPALAEQASSARLPAPLQRPLGPLPEGKRGEAPARRDALGGPRDDARTELPPTVWQSLMAAPRLVLAESSSPSMGFLCIGPWGSGAWRPWRDDVDRPGTRTAFQSGVGCNRRRQDHAGPPPGIGATPAPTPRLREHARRPVRSPIADGSARPRLRCSHLLPLVALTRPCHCPGAASVEIGGHNVPELVIRRRFWKSLVNFDRLYLPLATTWRVYDGSVARRPSLIAHGTGASQAAVLNRGDVAGDSQADRGGRMSRRPYARHREQHSGWRGD